MYISIRKIQEMIAENCSEIIQDEFEEAGQDIGKVSFQYLPKGRIEITTDHQRFLITVEEV